MAIIDDLRKLKRMFLALGTPDKEKVLYSNITKRVDVIDEDKDIKEIQTTQNIEEVEIIVEEIEVPQEEPKKPQTKREIKIELYKQDILKHFGEVDEDFLTIVVKNLGPSIYRANAELVSCEKDKELKTVKNNFLIKKLKLSKDDERLDSIVDEVCNELKSVKIKYRATFYYRLACKLDKKEALN